ncbi:hypothetical protein O7626_40400 [Micromonospora sp. WMMD1102]|uniref:hypothetical protein n=1 Tax=Micromonospora sp. WMMD1102 TaxID=3016105 RepID=UPI0024154F4C|nr:hypothetical protein [Micromonospora sp. WMMD1102]MDG4792080.1 hypothetical protein [Micromonospora sp. WMMD1102]
MEQTEVMSQADAQVACPPWCQPERHTINDDGSVTHEHLFGIVSGHEVTMRRVDRTDDAGKVKTGPVRAYAGPMSMAQLDDLYRLASQAAAAAGQRHSKSGGLA